MAPAQILVFLSQQPSAENWQFRVVGTPETVGVVSGAEQARQVQGVQGWAERQGVLRHVQCGQQRHPPLQHVRQRQEGPRLQEAPGARLG